MAPEALNDLLDALPPGRRQFLKTIITGTAFAAPLMASFSMDGLSVDAAAAATCGNLTFTPNMLVSQFLADPFSCSNATVPLSTKFRAILRDEVNGKKRGTVDFELPLDRCAVAYNLKLGGARLATVTFGTIGVPAAVLVVGLTPPAEYVLSRGKGDLDTALPCLPDIATLVFALDAGQAQVRVVTTAFIASGKVLPL